MPLVFRSATSADRPSRAAQSARQAVFPLPLVWIAVPRFVQVSGLGKNEWYWVDNLPHVERTCLNGHRPSATTAGSA